MTQPWTARLIGAAAIAVAAIPWLVAGARAPVVLGLVGVCASCAVALLPRLGRLLLVALAVVFVALCAVASVFSSPQWAAIQVDGVAFSGWMYALPAVIIVVTLAALMSHFVRPAR